MKVAIITGASRGIGREIAIKLHNDGYTICINYTSNEDCAKEALSLINNEGMIYKADVSNYNEAKELVEAVYKEYGRIDLLVNNAGIVKDNLILRMSEDEFDRVIDVNLKGTFNMIKHVSRYMLKARSGKIVNMSSIVGIKGNTGQINYAASKGGINALTKSAAAELAGRGILVNAIAPGFIQTEMTDALSEEVKESILSRIPLKMLGTTKDIANIVSFLASDNANYITGQIISVDGGMNL